ncbi:Polyphosphate kinase 2 (PPK2) [Planctomycetes bacterium Poly30]|uniref:Polyphosphate kinase 2 (PPK2) n=1 Tax=Saltatorellus ferox TaxID=2528018 RepID=A0A518F044_9BACT|nr:Polyphosphate kinase 2 (PPK2) [Planctomycetes bacterium Poly30]
MSSFIADKSPYLVPFDGSFRIDDAPTKSQDDPGKKECKKKLAEEVERLEEFQRVLYAHDHYAVLCVFQAMDAAGKDSTIRAVFSGVNPAGFQVHSFKRPSSNEIDHDFLWRTSKALPQRGRIGVFNRSYYEEVLVVKVHPKILDGQRLPDDVSFEERFAGRYQSLREHEAHLARNGVVVLKFFLNVSKKEQAQRFLDRLEEPSKNWKFAAGDMRERQHWDVYMEAYEKALQETSRAEAPWYCIPADDKPYMRWQVAKILRQTFEKLDMDYPSTDPVEAADYDLYRKELKAEIGD